MIVELDRTSVEPVSPLYKKPGGTRDLVLQGTEDSDGLLWQHVDARAEELSKLDQQHALFYGSCAEGDKHLD